MAAGRLLIPSWMPALDGDGAPIPNARVYFYTDETTTLASVFADEALTTPLTNPVEANSSGRFPAIWASDANVYTWSIDAPYGPAGIPFTGTGLQVSQDSAILVLEATEAAADDALAAAAAAEAALAEILAAAADYPDTIVGLLNKLNLNGDNIGANGPALLAAIGALSAGSLSGASGSSLVGTSASGTGAVTRTVQAKLRDFVSVKDFGAVGDGVADDTNAFSAAMLAAKGVFVPAGTYITSNIAAQQNGQYLFGVGIASRISFKAGSANYHFTSNGFTCALRDLDWFGGNDGGKAAVAAPASDRSGIKLDYNIECSIEGVTVHGYDNTGIGPENPASSVAGVFYANNVNIYSCWQGVSAQFAEYTRWTALSITSCRQGFFLGSGNITLADSLIEYNYDNLYIEGDGDANNGHGGVTNCRLNHASHFAVYANEITNAFNIIGCDIFYGQIIIVDCAGLKFIGNTISVESLGISGSTPNLFAYNSAITVPAASPPLNNTITDSGGRCEFIGNREASTGYPIWNTGSDVFGRANYTGLDARAMMIGENGALLSEGFEWTTNGAAGNMKLFKVAASVRASVATMIVNRLTGKVSQFVGEFASAVDDTAAATAGVPVGGLYQNAGAVRQRLV